MRALVHHLLANNREEILKRSRAHCHARNLHSIMLLESPGRTIRLFVAMPDHEMWMNDPFMFRYGMSVGFHAHHCNLTLQCALGEVGNWCVSENFVSGFDSEVQIRKFKYRSALRGEDPGFEEVGPSAIRTERIKMMRVGDHDYMQADEIHTVFVPKGQAAAWFVFEGSEDPAYEAITHSTSDLTKLDLTELYQPMSWSDITAALLVAKLL